MWPLVLEGEEEIAFLQSNSTVSWESVCFYYKNLCYKPIIFYSGLNLYFTAVILLKSWPL